MRKKFLIQLCVLKETIDRLSPQSFLKIDSFASSFECSKFLKSFLIFHPAISVHLKGVGITFGQNIYPCATPARPSTLQCKTTVSRGFQTLSLNAVNTQQHSSTRTHTTLEGGTSHFPTPSSYPGRQTITIILY